MASALSGLRRQEAYERFVARAIESLDLEGRDVSLGRWQTSDGRAMTDGPTGAMVWVRDGVDRVLLAMSDIAGAYAWLRGWASIAAPHRFLKQLPISVVYLRDDTGCLNLAGNRDLGPDYPACLAALRSLARERGWRRIYTFGSSGGGYAALRYGIDLGAEAVLSLSGPTSLERDDRLNGAIAQLETLWVRVPHLATDLLPLYRQAARRPRLLMCYGEDHKHDTLMATRMAEFPETELVKFPGFAGHSTFTEAMRDHSLGNLFARLIGIA